MSDPGSSRGGLDSPPDDRTRQLRLPGPAVSEMPAATRTPPPRPSTAPRSKPPVSKLRERQCPTAVTVSMRLWFAATSTVLVVAGAALTQFDRIHGRVETLAGQRDPGADPVTLDQVADVSVIVMLGLAVLLAVVQLTLAAAMQKGRSWARWSLLVWAALVGCYGLLVATGADTLGGLGDVVAGGVLLHATLAVAASIAMFMPSGRPWFFRGKLGPVFPDEKQLR